MASLGLIASRARPHMAYVKYVHRAELPNMDLTAAPFWSSFASMGETREQACARLDKAVKLPASFTMRVEQQGQPLMLRLMCASCTNNR